MGAGDCIPVAEAPSSLGRIRPPLPVTPIADPGTHVWPKSKQRLQGKPPTPVTLCWCGWTDVMSPKSLRRVLMGLLLCTAVRNFHQSIVHIHLVRSVRHAWHGSTDCLIAPASFAVGGRIDVAVACAAAAAAAGSGAAAAAAAPAGGAGGPLAGGSTSDATGAHCGGGVGEGHSSSKGGSMELVGRPVFR